MHADPPLLFPHNEDAAKVQTTSDFYKEHKQSAALCTNLSLSTWKATDSEERANQQHWGMLGRAPCLLPLECPGAAYISPAKPAAAPSATHSQWATAPHFPWNSATDLIRDLLLFTSMQVSCEIMDSSNERVPLTPTQMFDLSDCLVSQLVQSLSVTGNMVLHSSTEMSVQSKKKEMGFKSALGKPDLIHHKYESQSLPWLANTTDESVPRRTWLSGGEHSDIAAHHCALLSESVPASYRLTG